MLPRGTYDPWRVEELKWYLIQELHRTMADRNGLETDWIHYEDLYRAQPAESTKNFPFTGASNLVVGIIPTDVDTMYSRMMGLLIEPSNLWSMQAQRPELIDFAAATQEFLEWAQHNELHPHQWLPPWLIDIHKLGTGILKQRYTRDMKKVFEWRELDQGTWQQQAVIMLNDHPSIHHVPLINFFIPAGFKTINEAPWVAERIRMTWPRFMNRVKQGIYYNAERLAVNYFNPPINQAQQALDRISRYPASINAQMELYEFWLDFDIDGDGWDEALVCTISLDTQDYVRLDFNPFFNQEAPYSSARFMPDVNSFYGIGLAEMLDQFQEEITAMHNQRIDNGTVSNSQMYVTDKNETGLNLKEPMYPSKILRLNNPAAFSPVPMGSPGQLAQSINNEQATRAEAQRRTGVNDWMEANPNSTQAYGSAFTNQQMQINSAKRSGETLRDVREGLAETGTRILELYQQYNQRGKEFIALGPRSGQMVSMVLRFPLDLIRKGLRVSVTAIDAQTSKDAQIRSATLVMQELMQFYQNYMMMLSYVTNPQLPPMIQQTALAAAQGGAIMMRRLLELQGQQDVDTLIPELAGGISVQQRQLQNIQSLLGIGVTPGPNLGPAPMGPGPGQAPGPGPMAPGMQNSQGFGGGQTPSQQFAGSAPQSPGSTGYVR